MGEHDAGLLETGGPAGFVLDRPPPGLARGAYAWPAWAIVLEASLLVALVVTYFGLRVWQRRRRRRA